MGYLPPVGWAQVATKQDLELLRLEVRTEVAGLRIEMAELRTEMADRFRQQTLALVATMVTLAGVLGAAAALV